MRVIRVAVPSPLRRAFDYLLDTGENISPGCRVEVPFSGRAVVALVLEVDVEPDIAVERLKNISAVLDREPALDSQQMHLMHFASRYYHHPVGDVAQTFLPVAMRRSGKDAAAGVSRWQLTQAGREVDLATLTRAARQVSVLRILREAGVEGLTRAEVDALTDGGAGALGALAKRGWVQTSRLEPAVLPPLPEGGTVPLSEAQTLAITEVTKSLRTHRGFALDGVTGSGKTEVYLEIVRHAVEQGFGVLVLVPEIGLTPQMVDRFRSRLRTSIVVAHSGLTGGARAGAWRAARAGRGAVILGTRSAVFMPVPNLGLVIVDEEHDASYKQQDGLRYSARDLALVRAQASSAPVVLGSATPSFETLANVARGRFTHLTLTERAGGAERPLIQVVDLRAQRFAGSLAPQVMTLARQVLERSEQVIFFVNRRGYAPTLICHDCGEAQDCPRCDARLVLHQRDRRLRCHHCGLDRPAPKVCPACGVDALCAVGVGTERLEDELREHFPDVALARIDRDTTRKRGALEKSLDSARTGETQILIGTQMLAKGHHFPGVTLVVIVDADGGLFSVDFRATERMAQLITQVAGRAGRAERPGRVLIQTHQPEHPLLEALLKGTYADFARIALEERKMAGLPPIATMAMLRAEASAMGAALDFLDAARAVFPDAAVQIMGPVPAPMERRQGRFRAQLALCAVDRRALHHILESWVHLVAALPSARRVRWSLDIDPQDMT